MNNIYIYRFKHDEKIDGISKEISTTVIFCAGLKLNQAEIITEIKQFHVNHYQTDKIVVIGGSYLSKQLLETFYDKIADTFKYIPKREETYLKENLIIYTFDKGGKINKILGEESRNFKSKFLNEGLQNIFLSRGGLVESSGSHHFVFPSGKHCNRFLRTGNILLHSSEIYFIAFALLKKFNEDIHNKIYCDTSSINTLAFALISLKNRFLEKKIDVLVESFSSYEGLHNPTSFFLKNSFFLISSSTSGNIIKKIFDKFPIVDTNNIQLLFYLGPVNGLQNNIICNLTKSKSNKNGIEEYASYVKDNCQFCKSGSYALDVYGDVFLLDTPKICKHVLSVKDANEYLSDFIQQFMSDKKANSILKVNYKETPSTGEAYSIFIDYNDILNGFKKDKYSSYKQKINHYIDQYIPSNLKYIINLNDSASEELSNFILNQIQDNYIPSRVPIQIKQDNLEQITPDCKGAVLVVGSCISNGKNLLYLSRALRKHSELRIVYFVGLIRMNNESRLNFLISNLCHGNYGKNTNSFHAIESIYCDNSSKTNPWTSEISFLNEFIDHFRDILPAENIDIKFLENRKYILQDSLSVKKRGLSNSLFYPRIKTSTQNTEELYLRKNFAFFNFDNYFDDISQSDVYFTISNIINQLRNSKNSKQLTQSTYTRNLIDPANFDRFNDGIIQASILRSAKPEELKYSLDQICSEDIAATIETLIIYNNQEQGEALLEFLYALASRKMSLRKEHINKIFKSPKVSKLPSIHKLFITFILDNIDLIS
ncbi:hypothetical protein BWI96_07665 [Siphonobacter sp. SORGH_AS_0500]|uniref:hypothetical protein n=1 Tax=Siphonobacter sp. SORGH_AS_0500 TaxID=1864824 RepID=UPI000CBB235A|nr:hypothetical protein [Siphonobacter sp. SORGH_AS_0500]PKK37215.1 hypothetical protein BWI96_07665 [Siphonobacter sp. SORGH_AS_0500]